MRVRTADVPRVVLYILSAKINLPVKKKIHRIMRTTAFNEHSRWDIMRGLKNKAHGWDIL